MGTIWVWMHQQRDAVFILLSAPSLPCTLQFSPTRSHLTGRSTFTFSFLLFFPHHWFSILSYFPPDYLVPIDTEWTNTQKIALDFTDAYGAVLSISVIGFSRPHISRNRRKKKKRKKENKNWWRKKNETFKLLKDDVFFLTSLLLIEFIFQMYSAEKRSLVPRRK